jgi:hypothetical protein
MKIGGKMIFFAVAGLFADFILMKITNNAIQTAMIEEKNVTK